jgi:hypothetical protein
LRRRFGDDTVVSSSQRYRIMPPYPLLEAIWTKLRRSVLRPSAPTAFSPDLRSGTGLLPGYIALGCWQCGAAVLEERLELLIGQYSAELSGCRWCIELGRHRWRKALLPVVLLQQLRDHCTSALFSERDRAALMLTEAVARYTGRVAGAADQAVARARTHFTESEIARIAHLAAVEHFYDPATGAVGQDVDELNCKAVTPSPAIAPGFRTRGQP